MLIFLGGKLVGANFYAFCNYASDWLQHKCCCSFNLPACVNGPFWALEHHGFGHRLQSEQPGGKDFELNCWDSERAGVNDDFDDDKETKKEEDEKELMVVTLKASQIVEVHTRAANFPTSRGSTPELWRRTLPTVIKCEMCAHVVYFSRTPKVL